MVTDSDGRPQPRRGQAEWQKVRELTHLARTVLEPSRAPIRDQQRLDTGVAAGWTGGYAEVAIPAGGGGRRSHTVTRQRPASPPTPRAARQPADPPGRPA